MKHRRERRRREARQRPTKRQLRARSRHHHRSRPPLAYRQRGADRGRYGESFYAPEDWHEPTGADGLRFVVQPPGQGYIHPVTRDEVRQRIEQLPGRFQRNIEVVQFSRMTRKRALFPCYGMQWGPNIYLYPIEESLVETYVRPPKPQQQIEARMFGGEWFQDGPFWQLRWTPQTVKDFYLNNVLIHEIGHANDQRNTNFDARERYANWFAVEYGHRAKKRASGREAG